MEIYFMKYYKGFLIFQLLLSVYTHFLNWKSSNICEGRMHISLNWETKFHVNIVSVYYISDFSASISEHWKTIFRVRSTYFIQMESVHEYMLVSFLPVLIKSIFGVFEQDLSYTWKLKHQTIIYPLSVDKIILHPYNIFKCWLSKKTEKSSEIWNENSWCTKLWKKTMSTPNIP